MDKLIYFVVCETIDEGGYVLDFFECFNTDCASDAISWAEQHVQDYVASEEEQLTVLAVANGDLYQNYDEHDIVWCSQ